MGWKLLNRKTVFTSKFVTVYEDEVILSNGDIIKDYSLIEKPSIVMIVATDEYDNVLVLHEYKYGTDKIMATLPSGHIKQGESPIAAAKRELVEETGFISESFEEIGTLYDYPTKDIHRVYVVRAINIQKMKETQHENTEEIQFELITKEELKKQVRNKEWQITSSLAALTISGILN